MLPLIADAAPATLSVAASVPLHASATAPKQKDPGSLPRQLDTHRLNVEKNVRLPPAAVVHFETLISAKGRYGTSTSPIADSVETRYAKPPVVHPPSRDPPPVNP